MHEIENNYKFNLDLKFDQVKRILFGKGQSLKTAHELKEMGKKKHHILARKPHQGSGQVLMVQLPMEML